MLLCPECHEPVPDDALTCPHCGSERMLDGMRESEVLRRAGDPVVAYEKERRRDMRYSYALGLLTGAVFIGFLAYGLVTGGVASLGHLLFGGRRALIILLPVSIGLLVHAHGRQEEGREDFGEEEP